MGTRHRDSFCRGRGVRHCAVVRTRVVMARLHGKGGRPDRDALFPGRVRIFHRSYFYWGVSLWLETPLAAPALVFRIGGLCEWYRLRHVRRDGQCVDELACGLLTGGWQDDRD